MERPGSSSLLESRRSGIEVEAVEDIGSAETPSDHGNVLRKKLSSSQDAGVRNEAEKPLENISDELLLLRIMPTEIWEKIAECLDDGDDLHNLVKSSQFFEKLLEPKKILYLFPSVWNILGVKYLENYEMPTVCNELLGEDEEMEMVVCSSCGKAREARKSESGILKFRLVCKIWSNAVDKFIRTASLQQGHDRAVTSCSSILSGIILCEHWIQDTALKEENMEITLNSDFLRHFHGTHATTDGCKPTKRSPFLSGKLTLGPDCILSPVMDILKLYGNHVQHCDFYMSAESAQTPPTPASLYSVYRQAIELMPNLKQLEFDCPFTPDPGNEPNIIDPDDLIKEMGLSPVPVLKELQLLSFASISSEIATSILKRNSHVSTLSTNHMKEEDHFDIYTFPLPNLKRLRIVYQKEKNFSKLVNLQFPLNLTHLGLVFRYNPDRLSTVFEMISTKWGHTLTNLELRVLAGEPAGSGLVEGLHELRIQLPRLKAFSIKLPRFCSLEFLLSFKQTLENLELNFIPNCAKTSFQGKQKAARKEGIIKLYSVITPAKSSLLRSNIWEIFPKLKKIEIKYEESLKSKRTFNCSLSQTRQQWQLEKKESRVHGIGQAFNKIVTN